MHKAVVSPMDALCLAAAYLDGRKDDEVPNAEHGHALVSKAVNVYGPTGVSYEDLFLLFESRFDAITAAAGLKELALRLSYEETSLRALVLVFARDDPDDGLTDWTRALAIVGDATGERFRLYDPTAGPAGFQMHGVLVDALVAQHIAPLVPPGGRVKAFFARPKMASPEEAKKEFGVEEAPLSKENPDETEEKPVAATASVRRRPTPVVKKRAAAPKPDFAASAAKKASTGVDGSNEPSK